jgi:aspartate racemase
MHLGLIGGIGPAATEFYYRGLIGSCPPPLALTIAHADMATLRTNLMENNAARQAAIFSEHVDQLKAAGADVAAITSIAGHFCIGELAEISSLPLVNALSVLNDALSAMGLKRVALLGSKVAMQTHLYGTITDIEIVLPPEPTLSKVGEQYFAMAEAQHATEEQRELFFGAGRELCDTERADAVVLAGTDLFLAFADSDPGFRVIDSAEVHIMALSDAIKGG